MDWEESEAILGQLKSPGRVRRWVGLGAHPEELFTAFSRMGELSDWYPTFRSIGQSFEEAADASSQGQPQVANYLSAALYTHLGLLGTFSDDDRRIDAYRAVVDLYDKVRGSLRIPSERLNFTFEGRSYDGYLRRPPGVATPPCVVLLRGLDAAREIELHIISDFLLEKGLATFAIDLAGQGESRFAGLNLTPDAALTISGALDELETAAEIDSSQVGVLGQSFSGHLAVRASVADRRIRACVSLGSFYSLDDFEIRHMLKHNCMLNMKVDETGWPAARSAFTLDGVIEELTCPFLAVNGSEDVVIPPDQTVKMYERAPSDKDLKIYEGAPHCVYFDNKAALLDIGDWLLEKLGGSRG